jgi:peptide/nickel transport system ATP-binding protein
VTLKVEDVRLFYRTGAGVVRAVDGIDLEIGRDSTLAVLGESGCGKSSLARAILRLPPRNVETYDGRVLLDGVDILHLDDERFRTEVRWTRISWVPQASMNALNPVIKVGEQVAEPLMIHRALSRAEAVARAREMLGRVGLPGDFVDRYPFELSGGMRQRAMIAMALIAEPDLVILDEPTSALDVLTQANILNVLKKLRKERPFSVVLITHDIATSSEIADRVAVLYAGQVVEEAPAGVFYREPLHPYARMLMESVPRLRDEKRPASIPGEPPSLLNPPVGCRFAARCPARFAACDRDPPVFEKPGPHRVKCWLHQ